MPHQIKQSQLEQRTWQLSKDDIQSLLVRHNNVLPSIEHLRVSTHEKLDKQHEHVLESLARSRASVQSQMTQQVSTTSQVTSKALGELGSSFGVMVLKQTDNIRAQGSDILVSLAAIRVESSELHGQITQLLDSTPEYSSRREYDPAQLGIVLSSNEVASRIYRREQSIP
ncbi:hypothetical protein GGR52DRAFT_60508 [Hypoxylon sp. FL1284]|nr:hypothetical protein GGR52DRAFT_60508 [Hypoxylon sp. FL1284]